MKKPPIIHVVDDDASLRESTIELLEVAGFRTRGYESTGEFLLDPPSDAPGCLLLDVRLPGPSGLDLQAGMQRLGISLPVIFLTGYADVAASVRAMKAGAVDFLEKPVARGHKACPETRWHAARSARRRAAAGKQIGNAHAS
jgi:FixJ family two-component response regulator